MRHAMADNPGQTIGFIGIGALLGAIAAMLFAPKAGHELRADINNRFRETKEQTKNKFHAAELEAEELGDTTQDRVLPAAKTIKMASKTAPKRTTSTSSKPRTTTTTTTRARTRTLPSTASRRSTRT